MTVKQEDISTRTLNWVSVAHIAATVVLSVVVAAFAFGNDTAKKDAELHNTSTLISSHLVDSKEQADKDAKRDISIALIAQKVDMIQIDQTAVKTDISEIKKLVIRHMSDPK